jgi:hypothetical protein
MNNKIIFWDMDETLGFFRHFADYDKEDDVPENIAKFGRKEGIENLLQKLISDGFTHYVTTSGVEEYAKLALNVTGLSKYFRKLFPREKICHDLGLGFYGEKDYRVPLKDLGITDERAGSDVLIIGNSESDVPYNMKEIVSIIDADNWKRNSELTGKMIHMLMDNGNGDFNKGFHKMYDDSEKTEPRYKNPNLSKIGRMIIEDDVELHLQFMEEREKCSEAPIFLVRKADKYLTEN